MGWWYTHTGIRKKGFKQSSTKEKTKENGRGIENGKWKVQGKS
jgi:hypothetical protein